MYTYDIPKDFHRLDRSEFVTECLRLAREHEHSPDTLLSAVHLADKYCQSVDSTSECTQEYTQELAHVVTVLAAKAHEDRGYSNIAYTQSQFDNPAVINLWVELLQLTQLYVPRFMIMDTICRATITLANQDIDTPNSSHMEVKDADSGISELMEDVSFTDDGMSEDGSNLGIDVLAEANAYRKVNAEVDFLWNITHTIAEKNSLVRHDPDYQKLLSAAAMFLLIGNRFQYSRSAAQVAFHGLVEHIRVNSDLETEDILTQLIQSKS